jgi:hypothetical protein
MVYFFLVRERPTRASGPGKAESEWGQLGKKAGQKKRNFVSLLLGLDIDYLFYIA